MGGFAAILPFLIGAGGTAAGNIIGSAMQSGASKEAAQLGYQTGQNSLNALLNMYGLERGDRAPLRAVGLSALDTLQNWKPGGPNVLKPVDLSKFKPNTVDLPPSLGALTKPGTNPFSPPDYADTASSTRIRGLGPFNNPGSRNFASTTVNQLSQWTWNTLVPALKAGTLTPDQAEQQFNQAWNTWEQAMRNEKRMDSGVIENSLADQRRWFQPFYDLVNQMRQGQQPPAGGA